MVTNLKVTGTYGYQPHREVEPVPPYPRVNPKLPQEEYPRQNSQRRENAESGRRRFTAMRKLIDELKQDRRVVRVDYLTLENELTAAGMLRLNQSLVSRLLELKILSGAINRLVTQLKSESLIPILTSGSMLQETENPLPIYVPGLERLCLALNDLALEHESHTEVIEKIEKDGRYVVDREGIRLDLRPLPGSPVPSIFRLSIAVLVAVSEKDENGRKAILYQRPDGTFALYADKQIDLSI